MARILNSKHSKVLVAALLLLATIIACAPLTVLADSNSGDKMRLYAYEWVGSGYTGRNLCLNMAGSGNPYNGRNVNIYTRGTDDDQGWYKRLIGADTSSGYWVLANAKSSYAYALNVYGNPGKQQYNTNVYQTAGNRLWSQVYFYPNGGTSGIALPNFTYNNQMLGLTSVYPEKNQNVVWTTAYNQYYGAAWWTPPFSY